MECGLSSLKLDSGEKIGLITGFVIELWRKCRKIDVRKMAKVIANWRISYSKKLTTYLS
jgi:hypothetical protein